MRLEVTAITNGLTELVFNLEQRHTAVVGRGAAADVCMLRDPSLSRMHFELASVPAGFEILDLGSANGTYVQGRRIRLHRLDDHEVILAGRTVFLVRIIPSTISGDPALDVPDDERSAVRENILQAS